MESSKRDFVHPIRCRTKGGLVLLRLVGGIKHVGLYPSRTKPCERRACPHPSSTRNKFGGISSVCCEYVRKENLSSFVWYPKSSGLDIICAVRSCTKGELVIVHPARGINQAGLRPSGTKSHERSACLRPSGTGNQARETSSIRFEVA